MSTRETETYAAGGLTVPEVFALMRANIVVLVMLPNTYCACKWVQGAEGMYQEIGLFTLVAIMLIALNVVQFYFMPTVTRLVAPRWWARNVALERSKPIRWRVVLEEEGIAYARGGGKLPPLSISWNAITGLTKVVDETGDVIRLTIRFGDAKETIPRRLFPLKPLAESIEARFPPTADVVVRHRRIPTWLAEPSFVLQIVIVVLAVVLWSFGIEPFLF